MVNINVNLKGFSPQVYEFWKNGAYSWHGGIKSGMPFIKEDKVEIVVEEDYQLKLQL